MFHIFDRWLSKKKKRPKTRLSEQEVVAIARKAAAGQPSCEYLGLVMLEENEGVLTWIVGSATIGGSLEVWIDDASGEVLEIKQLGVR
jgi:uncharacterized membrane protein YkoI